MNFYAFHIGDYASATRHLSWEEDLAYRRLMDAYYMREAPLPADRKQVYRLVVATSKAQRTAVDTVLDEFFTVTPEGFFNERCEAEIRAYRRKSDKARQSAEARWSKGDAPQTESEGNANASADGMRTHSEGNAPNPNPNPNPNSRGDRLAREHDADLEAKLRNAAGWTNHPAPKLAITGCIQALLDSGADLDLDVLPVIRALAPKVRSPGWTYFVNPIAEARDQRISAATVVSLPTSSSRSTSHAAHRQKPSRDETFAAIDRRIAELAEAERRAAGGSQGGFVGSDEGAA
jgi:uncharacterized protein YdaU (DUF1376 family)